MKTVTITFTDDEWHEIKHFWESWADESFALHAAYALRRALVEAGYMEGE